MARRESGALDVTEGVIWRQLLELASPVLVQNLFQQLYLLVDAFAVGQFAGKEALGGIQSATALCNLGFNFCFGVCAGCAVTAGQRFGAHDDTGLSKAVHVGYALALVMGLAISLIGVALIAPALRLMGTPSELLGPALAYGRLFYASMVFWQLENMGAALLRAVGDSRTPSLVIVAACVVNAVLDIVFVGGLKLGAFGAQLATTISVLGSAACLTWYLMRTSGAWKLEPARIHLEGELAREMLGNGIPLGLQTAAFPLSNMLVQSSVNTHGADAVTAWGITDRLSSICWLYVDSIAVALTAFSAQNYGARKFNRMRSGLRNSLLWGLVGVGIVAGITLVFAQSLALLFIEDNAIAGLATTLVRYSVPFFLFYAASEMLAGQIRGAGESLRPMIIMLLGTCLFRIAWVLFVVPINPSLMTLILVYPASYVVTAAGFVLYYRYGHWLGYKTSITI